MHFRVSELSLCQICNWKTECGHNIYFDIITIYSQWLLYIFIWGISLYFISNFLVKTAGLLELRRLDMWCCVKYHNFTWLYFEKLQTQKDFNVPLFRANIVQKTDCITVSGVNSFLLLSVYVVTSNNKCSTHTVSVAL